MAKLNPLTWFTKPSSTSQANETQSPAVEKPRRSFFSKVVRCINCCIKPETLATLGAIVTVVGALTLTSCLPLGITLMVVGIGMVVVGAFCENCREYKSPNHYESGVKHHETQKGTQGSYQQTNEQ